MIQHVCKFILWLTGWKSVGELVREKKIIFVGVPHTSAWDFVFSWIYYTSLGGKANILIKKEFFFWPMGYIVRKMGGIPIDRSKGANVIRQIVQEFNRRDYMQLAITPEGTRKRTTRWKAGFHAIARQANVPVYLTSFDWGRKTLTIYGAFELSDNAEADIRRIKDFFREKGVKGKYPDQFTTDY